MLKDLVLDVTIEIPKNSKIKYEFDRETKQIRIDRILYGPSAYPQNYGFVKEALDWDGDELDVLVFADQEFLPGTIVPTRIIGALEMIDNGETDTKLIGIIDVDPRYKWIESMDHMPKHWLLEMKDFFETYKRLQKKHVLIKDFKDREWAIKEYFECKHLMEVHGSTPKEKFVEKMKNLHPEKYAN